MAFVAAISECQSRHVTRRHSDVTRKSLCNSCRLWFIEWNDSLTFAFRQNVQCVSKKWSYVILIVAVILFETRCSRRNQRIFKCYHLHLQFLAERYYVTFGLWHEPTVCRLSSITLLHPGQKLELFGNIFAPPNSSETWTVCVKILGKNSKGF